MDPNHYIWICWPQLRLDTIVTLMQILVNLSRMGHRYTWEDIPNGTCINYDSRVIGLSTETPLSGGMG